MAATPRLRPVATQQPQSLAAEEALLGGLLLETKAWPRIAEQVRADDFSRPDHRLIFEAIGFLAGAEKPCDAVTVSELLERDGQLDNVGGFAYISSIARETPTAANVSEYAKAVAEKARLRRLSEAGAEIEEAVGNGLSSTQIIERLDRTLETLRVHQTPGSLQIEPASAWADRAPPAPRDWVIDGLVPAGRVTSLLGNGGIGKTLFAAQIAVHVAIGRPLFGQSVSGGSVLGLFCEDEQEELERRARAACAGEQIELESLDRLYMLSRDGMDNLLCTFEREQIQVTQFYRELDATIGRLKPRLTILDTAADLFGGDFMSTPQVRQFLKVALGGLCVRHHTAILLLAHPSAAGMSSGDGGGFSTAWNNSVRSRLYLRRPKTEDADEAKDRRVLEVRKSNYAADGTTVALRYESGYFVPDPNPLEEGAKPTRAPRTDTRLAVAAINHLRTAGAPGKIISFGQIFEPLKAAGDLGTGSDEALRKKLQRTLDHLVKDGLVARTNVPRGYRLAPATPEMP
ncbi:MAG TPA: AAA family ATPase [Steroidobacteraceae bacterium]|nr:AAA family ATPase [Steroidobacteraceae bacterium]